jgi:hypothetical protein
MHIPQHTGLASAVQSDANLRNGASQQRRPQDPNAPQSIDISDLSLEDLEALRSREITAKAVSGILLILIKWFKVSRGLNEHICWDLTDFNRYLKV